MILGSLEEYGYYFLEARFRAGYVSRLTGRRGSYYILLFEFVVYVWFVTTYSLSRFQFCLKVSLKREN